MIRNHLVVALAAVGFVGLQGCGGAPPVAVAVPAPAVPVATVDVTPPPPPAPPPPRLVAVCDGVIGPMGHFKFPHEVEFATGKATIKHTPTTDAILQCLVDFMNTNKMVTKLKVDGHTDNQGDATANLKLSQDRADAIVGFLTGKGVDLGRFETKGWGPNKPVAPNDSPDHMAMNRRVEFWIDQVNGMKSTRDIIATAMNPPAPAAVTTTAVVATPAIAVPTVGVAVPTVAVPTVGVAVATPTVGVAVPGVAVGVTAAPGAPGKKK